MPKLTLQDVRGGLGTTTPASPAPAGQKSVGVRDFVSKEELQELHDRHFERSVAKKKLFDGVDSLVGEIIGRFGWETYEKWNNGEIDLEWMARIINAERAREKAMLMEIESVTYASVVSTIAKHPKKTLAGVEKILEQNKKIIKGEEL